ncbi:MAG: hypothetical protein IKT33_00300 [Clostridia bacterium]|nr:hypothetical protein [Clostridia bacterium]
MSRTAYITNIFVRGFFIFIVVYLLLRQLFWALFLAVGINVIYELTAGRKFWQAWRNAPKKPRRNWRGVLRDLWRRAFSRERTKGLVFAGIILLLTSYVVKFQVYYILVACLVFTLAAISRFAPPVKSDTIKHESSGDTNLGSTTGTPPTTK